MKIKLLLISLICSFSQPSYSLEVYKTGIKLSSSLAETYCQNVTYNDKSDWRMASINDMLELLDQGIIIETTHCSSTIRSSTYATYNKCLNQNGQLSEYSSSQSFDVMCIRGESQFTSTPLEKECPDASFSMSRGELHIPLVTVPDLIGNIHRYDVRLKMITDDFKFDLLDASKIE